MDNVQKIENAGTSRPDSDVKNFRLRVLTPLKTICDKEVSMVIARTVDGDVGVLRGHEPRSALLGDGMLRVFRDNKERKDEALMVLGGMIAIRDAEVTVISEIAESPDKLQEFIDRLDAERAANAKGEVSGEDLYARRLEIAIRQALAHMDVNSSTLIKEQRSETN